MMRILVTVILAGIQFCYAQLLVKNSLGMVMRVDSDGYIGFRTAQTKGLVNIDSLGNTYSFYNMQGNTNTARSCLFIDTKENIDYMSTTKNVGIHVFTHADANPLSLSEAKQNIAISAHLYNAERDVTIGVANLGENWTLGPDDPDRRDVTIVKGSLQNPDEMVMGNDMRRISAVEGSVKSSNNTEDPTVVFAGYFSGAKTYVGGPLFIGRKKEQSGEIGENVNLYVYSTETNTAAKMRLRGPGDGVRYSNIQMARTQDEEKWIINYREAATEFGEDLLFTHYSPHHSGNGYAATVAFEHDTGYLTLHRGGTLFNRINTPNHSTIPAGHVLLYLAQDGDLRAMNSSGTIVKLTNF